LPCADPTNSGQSYDLPLVPYVAANQQTGPVPNLKDPGNAMQHQNHVRFSAEGQFRPNERMEELWKPLARITGPGGGILFDSSAYYIVLNPARLANKLQATSTEQGGVPPPYDLVNVDDPTNPNYFTADGTPYDPTISTVELCITGGRWENSGFCQALSPAAKSSLSKPEMTPLTRRMSPLNPFNGSQRAIHPKGVQNYNDQGSSSELCTTVTGTEAIDAGECGPSRIVQHVIDRRSNWTNPLLNGSTINSPIPTSVAPGLFATTNDTLATNGGNYGTWGKEHEWVRIYDGTPLVPQNLTVPTVGLGKIGSLAIDIAYSSSVAKDWTLAKIGGAKVGQTGRSVALTVEATSAGDGVSLIRRTPLVTKGGSVQFRIRTDQEGPVSVTACSDQWCFSKATVSLTLPKPNQWFEVTVPISMLNYFGNLSGLKVTASAARTTFAIDQMQFLTAPIGAPLKGIAYRPLPIG
jgi:hypothetical protein